MRADVADRRIWPVAAVAVVLAVAAVVAAVRRGRTLRAVAPELRTARLWRPKFIDNRATLAIARRHDPRTEPVDAVTVRRLAISGGQDAFAYEPVRRSRPSAALLWIHGGGMIMGHPEENHDLCSQIARDLGILVLSPRYRLAPEFPFPGGLDDCFAALRWLHDNAADRGIDRTRVAVGGASAGGGLAAAIAQRAHDEGLPVAFQLLLYPMLDDRTVLRHGHNARGRLVWTPRSNAFAWTSYLGHRPGARTPRPYAVAARRENLGGLPPAWIGVGDLDLFYEEDREYASRLQQAGVPVAIRIEPGMYHGAEKEFHAGVAAMHDFRQAMFDSLARAVR